MRWPRTKRRKVFCIGRNKTGTTSFGDAMRGLGYRVGDQLAGEVLLEDWGRRDFGRILDLARTADAFQDVPFSLAGTYEALDSAFPESKFVLTIRASAEEWYESLVRFHTKIVGAGRRPTAADLEALPYCSPGWLWRQQQLVYGVDEATLYDSALYMDHYRRHNERIEEYFEGRAGDLLVLDVGAPAAARSLSAFLGIFYTGWTFPHANVSR